MFFRVNINQLVDLLASDLRHILAHLYYFIIYLFLSIILCLLFLLILFLLSDFFLFTHYFISVFTFHTSDFLQKEESRTLDYFINGLSLLRIWI